MTWSLWWLQCWRPRHSLGSSCGKTITDDKSCKKGGGGSNKPRHPYYANRETCNRDRSHHSELNENSPRRTEGHPDQTTICIAFSGWLPTWNQDQVQGQVKIKVKVRSNKVTKKMLHDCRTTHVLSVIWDLEIDGGIHFWDWTEENSSYGQIRPNFKIQNFPAKHVHLVQFCLRIPRMLLFTYDNYKSQEMHFQIATPPLPAFDHCTANYTDIWILWHFGCFLVVYSLTTYIRIGG